jgi:hypothetical protein
MQIAKRLIAVFFSLLFLQSVHGQVLTVKDIVKMDSVQLAEYLNKKEKKVDSLLTINYLTYNYQYLGKDYQIEISDDLFNETLVKYSFHNEKIDTYEDSVSVVLMAEFNDWDQARIAGARICFSWQRLCYFTWQDVHEAKEMADNFVVSHPYEMYELLCNENSSVELEQFIDELKQKVFKGNKPEADNLSNKEILKQAFRSNPERIALANKLQDQRRKLREAYLKEHGSIDGAQLGVSCGKENCCQTKK